MRDSEVEDLHAARRCHHDVCRLQIAVDDAPMLSLLERVGDLLEDVEDRIEIQRAPLHDRLKRGALDEFHGDVVERAAVVLAMTDFVDHRDMRMVERRGGPSLGQQTQCAGVAVAIRAQRLQRDDPSQPEILRAIDVAHAAGSQAFDDAVVREGVADQRIGRHGSLV